MSQATGVFAPHYVVGTRRHPDFGYQTLSRRYLSALHVEHLTDADAGRYQRLDCDSSRAERIVDSELREDLLLNFGEITDWGRWHLYDRLNDARAYPLTTHRIGDTLQVQTLSGLVLDQQCLEILAEANTVRDLSRRHHNPTTVDDQQQKLMGAMRTAELFGPRWQISVWGTLALRAAGWSA